MAVWMGREFGREWIPRVSMAESLHCLPETATTLLIGYVLVTQSCLILWTPWVVTQPGSSVHGILQENILEWVAISFPRGSSHCRQTLYQLSYQGSLPWWLYPNTKKKLKKIFLKSTRTVPSPYLLNNTTYKYAKCEVM